MAYEDSDYEAAFDDREFESRIDGEAHWELFSELPGVDDLNHFDKLDLWEIYLDSMVGDELDRDYWWDQIGLDPADFDWEAWREAMYP